MNKTVKSIAVAFVWTLFSLTSFAQKAEDVKAKWEGSKVPAIYIIVDGDQETAIKTLKSMLKDEDLKVDKSGKKIKCKPGIFKEVSKDLLYYNAIVETESKGDNTSRVTVFMSKGLDAETFISKDSNKDAFNNMKDFLEDKYAKKQNDIAKEMRIEAQQEKVEKVQKEKEKKEAEIKKQNKKLEKAKKELEDNQKKMEQENKNLKDLK